jgi:hypothetical protein
VQHPTHGHPLHSQSPREQLKPECPRLRFLGWFLLEIVRKSWWPTGKSLFAHEICFIQVSLVCCVAENEFPSKDEKKDNGKEGPTSTAAT